VFDRDDRRRQFIQGMRTDAAADSLLPFLEKQQDVGIEDEQRHNVSASLSRSLRYSAMARFQGSSRGSPLSMPAKEASG
jgi:hypothetical protein